MDSKLLPHLALGFRFLVADFLWLRLVQDIDFKEASVVNKGWVFHLLDGITNLDKRYHVAYVSGATVLSVLVQDIDGAKILYDRAVENYPKDWVLAYKAASHNLLEVGDCRRAAELYQQAERNGAPPWVTALASRLYSALGQYELAKTVLIDALARFKDTELEKHLSARLIDLEKNKTEVSNIKCKN